MVQEAAPAPKRRLNVRGRILRRARIFERLREGWAYAAIAREEGLTARRIRQIVSETLQKRIVDPAADHAMLQLARLEPALKVSAEAIANGDVEAIAPYLKVLDRLDRYQRTAEPAHAYDEEARERLMAKINRLAAALDAKRARKPAALAGQAKVGEKREDEAGDQDAARKESNLDSCVSS